MLRVRWRRSWRGLVFPPGVRARVCYLPWLARQEVADALNGAPNQGIPCNVTPSAAVGGDPSALHFAAAGVLKHVIVGGGAGATFYADASKGSDSNPGTITAPFQTIGKVGNAV